MTRKRWSELTAVIFLLALLRNSDLLIWLSLGMAVYGYAWAADDWPRGRYARELDRLGDAIHRMNHRKP